MEAVHKVFIEWASGMQAVWDPRLAFTGTTVLGVNPENGELPITPLQHGSRVCWQYLAVLILHLTLYDHQLVDKGSL